MEWEVESSALYNANDLASKLYESALQSQIGKKALDYLHSRKFSDETIKIFRLGYAPKDWYFAFRELHQEQGIPTQNLLTAGIIRKKENPESIHDFFHDRITFPLYDYKGVVGFTARCIGSSGEGIPKYLNTPTTPIYNKSKFWYNLESALKAGKDSGKIFLVEGPTSVLRGSQNGLEYMVASCGTSITEEHIATIRKRFRQGDLVLCTDGDSAGQQAAERIVSLNLQYGLKVCILPEGKDPDDVMREASSKDYFLNWAEFCTFEGTDFLINLFSKGDILNKVEDKKRVLDSFKPVINRVPLEKRAFYIEAIAQRIGISKESISSFFVDASEKDSTTNSSSYFTTRGGNGWERRFWQIMFNAGAPRDIFKMYESILNNGVFSLLESKALIGYAQEKDWKIQVDGLDTPLLGVNVLTNLISDVKDYAVTKNLSLNEEVLASLIRRDSQELSVSSFPNNSGSISEIEEILGHLLSLEAERVLKQKFLSGELSIKSLSKKVEDLKS